MLSSKPMGFFFSTSITCSKETKYISLYISALRSSGDETQMNSFNNSRIPLSHSAILILYDW